MPGSDKFDFDSLIEDQSPDTGDDFFLFDAEPEIKKNSETKKKDLEPAPPEKKGEENNLHLQKRSSADFSPDMDALLLTAQSSMIVEAMKLISIHDFKSKNIPVFSEAIKGIDLYIKILERNPANFNKLTSLLSIDQDCMDVQKVTFNLFRNTTGELPETDSKKLKAFELINEKLKNAYNKSLIASSIKSIKKYCLLSGSIDPSKIDNEIQNDPSGLKNQINIYMNHINIGRQMIKSGNSEIIKGMKGKELNVFIINATRMLSYYFSCTGETELSSFYTKLHENFKKYFIVR